MGEMAFGPGHPESPFCRTVAIPSPCSALLFSVTRTSSLCLLRRDAVFKMPLMALDLGGSEEGWWPHYCSAPFNVSLIFCLRNGRKWVKNHIHGRAWPAAHWLG